MIWEIEMRNILFFISIIICPNIYAATYPSISKQPQDITVTVGAPVTFVIVATGAIPISYQWQKNPNTGVYGNILGATSTFYGADPTLITDNGSRFRCQVSNSYGKAISNPGILFVNPVISTAPIETFNVLTDYQLNTIKESIWINVFRTIANLDDSYFVGIATANWALNTSSNTFHWVPVNIDTVTGIACFISSPTAASWNDTFKMNVIDSLFAKSLDDVTYPYDSIDSLDEARNLGVFH